MTSAKQKYHILRRAYCALQQAATPKQWGLGLFLILFTLSTILYTRAGMDTRVYAAPSNHLNFQARLLTGNGGIVPDGNYSVQFNLYNVSSGGTTQWTETQATVPVRAGYLSVYLGSITAFPGTIDWSQQQWLTMNVNGDGEMTPRLKLTAVPNAMHANEATALRNGSGLLTADNLAQLAPATPQVINSALAALRLNQTGIGLLAQLQGDGADIFTVAKNGNTYVKGTLDIDGATLDIGTATQAGGLVLHNGDSKTGTIQAGSLSANRTYTLPDADGTICLTTTCTGGGGGPVNSFVQDGNSFATTGTLGTNDNFGLAFETNATRRMLIDANGNIGIGTSGSPSQLLSIGGTTGNLTVNSSGALVAATLTSNGALSVLSGGASVTGGLNNNSGGITNAGSITGVGSNITAVSALTIASGGSGDLILNSASGLAILGATTLQTADSLLLDMSKATDTVMSLQNSGAGIASLNLVDGDLQTAGVVRLTNGGVLQNITGLTVSSGNANFNGNVTLGDTTSDRLTVASQLLGANALVFQGATDDSFATTLTIADPTANNTITLPNGSGTLLFDSRSVLTAAGSGLSGGGSLSADLSLSLDINGVTTKTNVNPTDYLVVHDATTSAIRKITRNDFLQGLIGALIYRGTWDASTNTPALADNTGTNGDMYVVSVAGSQNFGQGPSISFGVGDFVIYNGTEWEKAPSSSDVSSVFGRTGAITAQGGDYTATQITNTPAGTIAATNVQGALNELATEKLGSLNGLTAISQTFVNDTNVTITSSGSAHTLGWSGQLSVARGGTGAASFTTNGVIYGNNTGTLQVTAAGTGGQILVANATGVPTFVSVSGDATLSATGVLTIGADKVVLTTDTVGNYVANLGTLTGLSTTGNTGEGSTPTLSVIYGSAANTSVQGNTTLTISAGTNLGGGGTITLGAGGTVTLSTIANPTFTTVTAATLTSTAGLAINSGGTGDITLDSASNKVVIASTDTTLERTAAGSYTIDLKDNAATSLVLSNSSAGGSSVANLNLLDGALQIAGTTVIGSDRTLQNLAGITNIGVFTTSGGIASLNDASNFATNINTGTSTGTVTIGGGTAPLVINSTNFDVSAAGALSGITTLNASGLVTSVGLTAGAGLIQGTGGLTITGAVSLNASANFATSINTGTSTGTMTFGGGTAPLVINSTAFDVTSTGALSGITTLSLSGAITGATATNTINGLIINAGALSGITTLTASGRINSTVGFAHNNVNGGTISCSANNFLGTQVVRGGIIISGTCETDDTGISDARLKTNVEQVGSVLDQLKNLNVVNYNFKCEDPAFESLNLGCEDQTGVLAQELAQVFPELVSMGPDGYYRVRQRSLQFYNLRAVGEISTKLSSNGDARLNDVSTGGVLRLNNSGQLQNINGLNIVSGGANVTGGLNNNAGGIANAGAILGATTISGQNLTLDANSADNLLTLKKDSAGVFTILNNGALEMRVSADNAFALKDANGKDYFSVNTNGGLIRLGSALSDDLAVLLVLDSKNTAGDPQGVNGAQYYNEATHRFRCYQNNLWQDCLQSANSEYVLVPQQQNWSVPSADTEFTGQPRTWTDLTNAREFRMTMRLTVAGASTADCRLQYAVSDNGPWKNLDGQTGPELSIATAGSLKTPWGTLATDARGEVLIRVMCKEGTTGTRPEFYGIKMQVR